MSEAKKLFYIAFKNLKCHIWLNIKIVLALTSFVFLICMFCIFPVSLATAQNSYKTKYVSANFIKSNDNLDGILTQKHSKYCVQQCFTDVKYYQEISIRVGEYEYNCSHNTLLPFSINSGEIFTQNDYKALKAVYGLDSLIIGDMPADSNGVLVSELMLEWYGLKKDDVLKKYISLINLSNGREIGGAVTVSGIIRKEFYTLYGHTTELNIQPSVYVNDVNSLGISKCDTFYIYAFDEYQSKDTVEEWVKDGLIKDKNGYCWSILSSMEFIQHLQQVTLELFCVLGVLICAGIIFTVYLLMDKYVKYFSRSGGILSVCGTTPNQLNIIIYMQLFIFCIISAILSFAVAAGVYRVLGGFLGWYLSGEVLSLDFRLLSVLFGIVLISVFVVSALIFAFIRLTMRKATVKQLLETRAQ